MDRFDIEMNFENSETKTNFRQLLKKSDTLLGLVKDLQKIQMYLNYRFPSNALRIYLKSNQVKKLQIGAGPIALPGWLGTDLRPTSERVAFLDATRPFPFDDNTFDYIHSEHMIEHIIGRGVLPRVQRILNLKVRIATPILRYM
jgi:hypothetical protein